MSKYHDDNTTATNPSGLSLNGSKLESLKKTLPVIKRILTNFQYPLDVLDEYVKLGDNRAAIVLQTYNRLIVAAYTDELDCIALLEFPIHFVKENNLEVGDRLLAINTYSKGKTITSDPDNGPESNELYNNFHTLISDFLSYDHLAIQSFCTKGYESIKTLKMEHKKLIRKYVIPRNNIPYSSDSTVKNKQNSENLQSSATYLSIA